MNVNISPDIWSDADFEALHADLKLAAFWLHTNPRLNLAGYAEISERRFVFETGLKAEALAKAFQALPKAFRRDADGYWVRTYIRRQFGQGVALVRNNFCKPLVRCIEGLQSPSVVLWILEEYPELDSVVNARREGEALAEGLASHAQAPEQSREEKRREERRGVRGGAGGGGKPAEVAEVAAYFAELGAPEAEAVKFFDHYEANGWKQGGRAAIKSWRAAARSWVTRWRESGGDSASGGKISSGGDGPAVPAGAGGLCLPDAEPSAGAGEGRAA